MNFIKILTKKSVSITLNNVAIVFLLITCQTIFCSKIPYQKTNYISNQIAIEKNHYGLPDYNQKKDWTVIIYMAADNNLHPFASRNIAQMKQIGSNENINIVVYLDIHQPGQEKVAKYLYIAPNQILQIGQDRCLDSGKAETVIDFSLWAFDRFPSNKKAMIVWNHGSGDLNPKIERCINPAHLFYYNSVTKRIELDRSIGFLEIIDQLCLENNAINSYTRGICFDDTNNSYLNDEKLMQAFTEIVKKHNGKKIDLVIFDACLMAGTGTTYIISKFADYMVASEEVVLGPGYDYNKVFSLFMKKNITPKDFALHIVDCYEKLYGPITYDYTHSALDLAEFKKLYNNIDTLAQLLIQAMNVELHASTTQAIKRSRQKNLCTYFDEPSYIDLKHFYENLLYNSSMIQLPSTHKNIKNQIIATLEEGILVIKKLVIANVKGKNLSRAGGISTYFPERKMHGPTHASYDYTEFGKNNHWRLFLYNYFNKI